MREFLFYNRLTESVRYVSIYEEYNPEGYWIDDDFNLFLGAKQVFRSKGKDDLINYIKRTNPNLLTELNLVAQQNNAQNVDPNKFNPEALRTITSYSGKIKYCDGMLEKIGSGSSRIVYKIDEQKVLKLAKNSKGLAQNETEINQGRDYYLKSLVAEVFDYDEDNVWIVAEFCHKITKKKFKELVGISFDDFASAVRYEVNNMKGKKVWGKPEFDYSENEFITEIVDYAMNYDAGVGDLERISSYGINSKGSVVLTDYGLTDDIFKEHYSKRR